MCLRFEIIPPKKCCLKNNKVDFYARVLKQTDRSGMSNEGHGHGALQPGLVMLETHEGGPRGRSRRVRTGTLGLAHFHPEGEEPGGQGLQATVNDLECSQCLESGSLV